MNHHVTVCRTGRHTAPLRLDCSCGETTTADTMTMAADRTGAHLTAAGARDARVAAAGRAPSFLRHHAR